MLDKNPFEVLGVTPQAELVVIHAAYRALAKMYHPDVQQGLSPEEAGKRMSELNWAWEELRQDLAGWRVRVLSEQRAAPSQQPEAATARAKQRRPEGEPITRFDEEGWRRFTAQYRRPRGDLKGWRAWIGSDVVCKECGCALVTEVYKCPDCGQIRRWKRSKLYTIGHHLSPLSTALLYVGALVVAVPMVLGMLAIPPILLLDVTGVIADDSGGPWEWGVNEQILFALCMAAEVGLIAGWMMYQRKASAGTR